MQIVFYPYSISIYDNKYKAKFEYNDSYSGRKHIDYLFLTYNKNGDIIDQTLRRNHNFRYESIGDCFYSLPINNKESN